MMMTVMNWIPEEYLPVMYLEPVFPLGISAFFSVKQGECHLTLSLHTLVPQPGHPFHAFCLMNSYISATP